MAKDLAIVLNNGSINAAVTTALAAQKYRLIMVYAETASGQQRIRSAYEQQVSFFKPYREHTLQMPYLAMVATPDRQQPPDPRIPQTITPQLVDLLPLVATAARFAIHYSASAIFCGLRVGARTDELAQGTEYIQIWQELLQMTCGQPDLEISLPLMELEPWQVVDTGCNLSAPFDRTWSCSEEGMEACWACRGCRAREAAFQQAAKPDPLKSTRKP